MPYEYKQFYRRKRPHIHSPGATLFVTFRLAGSIPQTLVAQKKSERIWLENELRRVTKLAEESADVLLQKHRDRLLIHHRKWFARYEEILHLAEVGPRWLKDPAIAQIVYDAFLFRDGEIFRLHAFCIMSNHVHAVFTPFLDERSIREVPRSRPLRYESDQPPLEVIMQSLKGYTARKANVVLGRTGTFWEVESFDHEIRDSDEHDRIVSYTLNNPVKAGLVKEWRDWPWNWRAGSA